jgi:PadR family transcriptional regulator
MAGATPLGEFEQLVLLALLHVGDRAYGIPVRDEIARRAGRAVSLGSVYKTLERLEDKGLVASSIGDPTPERGGRRKKFYRVEPRGIRALRLSLAGLRAMTSGLEPLLEQ